MRSCREEDARWVAVFLLSLFLVIIVSGKGWCREEEPILFSGEQWNSIPNTLSGRANKASYLRGVYEGALVIDEGAARELYFYDIGDRRTLVDAVDQFYRDYRNVRIPVPYALLIVAKELRGLREEEIEQHVRELRRRFGGH